MITTERIEEIFEETKSKWDVDNAYKGLQILSKYSENLITGADHDIIYSVCVEEAIRNGIPEQDVIELAKLNWMLYEDYCFACYV